MSILLADIDATCAALGYSDGDKYHAEPDVVRGLKHLIWILRRDLDNHEYRRHLGRSKVLQTDLVHMLPSYIDDDEFADVLIRLLVILTNPTLLLYRDGAPKDGHGRKVFMELIAILQNYKSAFRSNKIWAALLLKTQKSLEIDWALRTEEQGLLIERVLVLIRNVLQVPANPEAECRADNDASLHDQVIWALHQSGIIDLVLYVVSSPDENQYHLHALEILCLLFREQTAESLADASLQRSTSEKQRDEQELIAARRREKQKLVARPPPGRHSRFGGTYVIQNFRSVSDKDAICHQSLERAVAIDFDREKERQKKSHRIIKEENQSVRRSAFSVRLCLREFCIEVLRSAYNTLVRQVRRILERNSGSTSHDDSYLLWALKFFMEFNRLSGMQMHLVSESLSVQCFHWVLTRMQHDMDMMTTDKKQARLWAKRLHVALQTFRELILSLLALQKLRDSKARALFDMLLNNVCYVLEYRETILHLLMNYNESHSTKTYLRDVIETAHIFIKMMEKFCKDSVVVQDKCRKKKSSKKNSQKQTSEKNTHETEEQLENKWVEMSSQISTILPNELSLPEGDQPIPFDAASEKHIDDQKEDCMIRIHKFLREEKLEHAIALMRSAREVWPENDCFGSMSAAPEDELLLLREIFLYNIGSDEQTPHEDAYEDNYESDEEEGDIGVVEKTFKFNDFEKRLLHPKIVRACTIVVSEWEQISAKSLKSAVTIFHRIAYGCSCPAMLYQAALFKIFQQVFDAPRDPQWEDLRRLGVYVIRKFVETAPKNPKIYAELFFYKTIRDANELETGYSDIYDSGTKGTWTEEQENELRFLFEENQNNPQTDQDVIDWILENLIDKTRTRRGVLKKLRELDLQFKAPTKKSSAAMANKDLWQMEEDDELKGLYDEHRLNDDCLQKIVDAFGERRSRNHIIKRMLQLHIIADKSEILPAKTKKKKQSKKVDSAEGSTGKSKSGKTKKAKPSQKQKRKIIRTPLDTGTVRSLIDNLDTKYTDAVKWLKESFADAAEDMESETPTEEDDGVPLLPLLEIQKDAMEDEDFKRVLLALGVQPPIAEMENYWRIPFYLNAGDLKLRERILDGEEIEENEMNVDEEEEDQHDDEPRGDVSSGEESEEDYLDKFMSKRREKMNSLVYNKSDDENEERVTSSTKKNPTNQPVYSTEKDTDETDFNSEDYRKRLEELGDTDSESDDSNKTVIENTRFRSNRIYSDSEDEGVEEGSKNNESKKRPRSNEDGSDQVAEITSSDVGDDEGMSKLTAGRTKSNDEPKRRRIAVIEDDDDD